MGLKNYDRHSAAVIRSTRWKFVRLAVKRRDGFKCVKCGEAGRIEVDHILPVRTNPELAFEMTNLQSLCTPCHSSKTKKECGFGNETTPARHAWHALIAAMVAKSNRKRLSNVD